MSKPRKGESLATYLARSVDELEAMALAAEPGTIAAVNAKKAAIDTRAKLEQAIAPKEKPLPKGTPRIEILRHQVAKMQADQAAIKARDAGTWIKLMGEIRITTDEIDRLAAEEEAKGTQGTDAEMEAAVVATVGTWAEKRKEGTVLQLLDGMSAAARSRIVGHLLATTGQG